MSRISEYAVSEKGTYCLHPVWHASAAAAQAEIDALPHPERYHVIQLTYDDPTEELRAALEAKHKAERAALDAKLAGELEALTARTAAQQTGS